MAFSYRTFRKQFFRAKRAYQALAAQGAFKLRLAANASSNRTEIQFSVPNDANAVHFAVLMRPFLDPSSDSHYRRVFAQIAADAPDLISESDRALVESEQAAMEAGDLPIRLDGTSLSAQELYTALADGEFFHADAAATQRLGQLNELGPLIWFHFYGLAVNAYHHVGRLYGLFLMLRSRANDQRPPLAYPETCIFCKRSDRTFNSVEHIIPEALGNDELVLPPGIVCDTCNGGFSPLDQELRDFPLIAMCRVFYAPLTKRGRFQSAVFEGISVTKIHPRRVEIRVQGQATGPLLQADGHFEWTVQSARPINRHRLARALCKIGLEQVALDLGPQVALGRRFDLAREFVLGTRTTLPTHFFFRTRGKPGPEITLTQFADAPGTLTVVDIYGARFAFSLEGAPLCPPALPFDVPFEAFDLSAPPDSGSGR